MGREIKFQFVFQHAESKEVIISSDYSLEELLDLSLEDISEKCCDCDCQPTGESSYKDCNCLDYYVEFEVIAKRQFTGLKDKNGVDIYEGDIVRTDFKQDGSHESIQVIEFYEGSFGSRNKEDHFRIPALFSGRAIEGMNTNYYEVIGNIHQHKHLLEC